ncbi:MAG: hypothetical protein IJN51_01265 [Alistipes sp.]|nr:hypothetical protein [Alistipes sp.]MBQ8854049.1 hypothetical protein [Alistipes sp.]
MAIYDNKPSIFEANGDGSYTYRWNIKEVEIAAGGESEETATKWECEEVIVWGTVTSDKLTEAVIGKMCPVGREQKLINEFNAANLGVYGAKTSTAAQEKIAAYKSFLTERDALKAQVDADCATLKIL